MTRYSFDAKVFMSGEIEAASEEEARRMVRHLIGAMDARSTSIALDGEINIEGEEDEPAETPH